jgi:hypothetical protein
MDAVVHIQRGTVGLKASAKTAKSLVAKQNARRL